MLGNFTWELAGQKYLCIGTREANTWSLVLPAAFHAQILCFIITHKTQELLSHKFLLDSPPSSTEQDRHGGSMLLIQFVFRLLQVHVQRNSKCSYQLSKANWTTHIITEQLVYTRILMARDLILFSLCTTLGVYQVQSLHFT